MLSTKTLEEKMHRKGRVSETERERTRKIEEGADECREGGPSSNSSNKNLGSLRVMYPAIYLYLCILLFFTIGNLSSKFYSSCFCL